MKPLLNEKEVAQLLHLSIGTLRDWRWDNKGPKFRKLGRAVRYDSADVDQWINSLPTGGGNPHRHKKR